MYQGSVYCHAWRNKTEDLGSFVQNTGIYDYRSKLPTLPIGAGAEYEERCEGGRKHAILMGGFTTTLKRINP